MHVVGVSAALVAATALMLAAQASGRLLTGIVAGLYAAGLLVALGSSAAYHMVREGRWKPWLRRLDHAAIFAMIAGTYTPIVALAIPGTLGWSLLAVVWAGAVVGAALKLMLPDRLERLSIPIYLLLGWAGVVALGPLRDALGDTDLALLAAGGLLYSLGVIVHLSTRLRFQNALWHLFVLIAMGLHFALVYRLVSPAPD